MPTNSTRKLIPASQWNQHHEWPPPGGLRHLIFNAEKNGFQECVVRIGRRVLIDESQFFSWVDNRSGREMESEVKVASPNP